MKDLLAKVGTDFETIFKRQEPPKPQPCHACGHPYAGVACPLCREERPAFIAFKNVAATQPNAVRTNAVRCRYHPESICHCRGTGTCLDVA